MSYIATVLSSCVRVCYTHTQVFLEAQYKHHIIGDPSVRHSFTLSDELS
jgi:hypothetical protein